MSDIEFRDVLGLPKKEEQPPTRPLFESPPQVPEAFPFAPRPLDPWREYLRLPTSPMYRRKKGIIPEPPDPEDPAQDLMAILATSENPELEIAKINAALSVAENLKLDPRQVYVNLEALSEHWYGKILQPPVFAQQLRDAWDNGMMNYNIGKLALRLREAGGEDEELIKQIREIESAMKPMTDIPRPWIQNAMMWAMESSPLMAQSFLRGGVTGAATRAVAGAMYGAVGAPLTGGLSVPAMTLAMASVGFAVGMTQDFMEIGRGLAYWRHYEQGVPHNIAAPLGDIEGVITGAIESIGSILIGLKIPGLTPALKSAGTLVANKMMATGVVSAIATRLIGQVGGVGLAEGIEEPLQELTEIFMDQLARELSKNQDIVTAIEPITLQNVIQRTGQAFYTGMSAGLVFGMVGAPGGISADVRQLSTIREIAEKAPTRLGFINTIIRGDYVLQETGASEVAWREYLGKVWDKQHPGKAPVAAVPVTAEGAPAPRAAVVRTPEERLYTQVEERTRTREGVTAVLKAGDPTTGQRYGYVQYETVGDRIYIEDVVNETETDMRRELVLDLAARYPGQEIEWNPTDELDVALRQDLIATNPRGAEYGLQWFEAAAAPAAQQELTRGLFVQRMGELFTADTPEQAEFYGKLTDVIAKVSGQTTEEWLRKYISPEVTATTKETEEALAAGRGVAATRFMVEGRPISPLAVDLEEFKGQVKAVFTALGKADFHTGVHEFFHAVERLSLSTEQIKKFETALGKLRETWATEDIEKLADYFEDYLATGKAPTPELQTVFQQIAAALKELISFLKERLGGEVRLLSPEFEKAYDSLFAKPESGLAQAQEVTPEAPPAVEVSQVEEGIEPSAEDAVTIIHPSAVPPQEIELSRIILSKEVPNFKEMADKRGIIEPLLAEEYVKVGIPPIVLWERFDGTLEIITGRHRLDLAQRLKLPTILSQIVREADGFTAAMAGSFDAESNIRDGQGSVRDYAAYFKNRGLTVQEASRRGLLDRHKGRSGFAIGRYAADGLYSLYRNNKIPETKAAAIAAASLGDERLQGLGISKSKKLSADELGNFIALARQQVTTTEGVQSDMFGFDDTLIREGEKVAKAVSAKKADLLQERQALSSALRLSRGAQAKIVEKYGFKAGDVAAIQDRVDVLGAELVSWENWTQDPQKMREARELAGLPVAKELLHPEGEEPPGFELTPWDDKLLRPKEKATQPIFGFAEERDVGLKDWTKTPEGWQHISGKMADKVLALELTRMKDLADNLSLFHRDKALQDEFNKAAIKIFGTTEKPEYCGWILSDGRMLDFNWGKYKNKARYFGRIYHGEINQVFKLIDPNSRRYNRGAYSNAWKAGTIRLDMTHDGEVSVTSTMIPTPEQMRAIEDAMMGTKTLFLEIVGTDIDERTLGFERLEDPEMRDIRRFYTKMAGRMGPQELFHPELPEPPPIPQKGTYLAILTDDGSIYVDLSLGFSAHVPFIKKMGIPPGRIVSGGWVKDGIYDADIYSDTMRFVDRYKSQLRITGKKPEALFHPDGGISFDVNTVSNEILDKMNRTMKAAGYDVRGTEDVRALLKSGGQLVRDGILWQKDWIDAYEKAIGSEKARKERAAAKTKEKAQYKNINWERVRELGKTTDIREAGYIYPDGSFLDFSGKREGGQPRQRSYDHREVGGTDGMQEFMALGNIRMDYASGMIDISKIPTSKQFAIIEQIAKKHNGEIGLDLAEGLGEYSEGNEYYRNPEWFFSQLYPEGTRPARILNDIKKFYSGQQPVALMHPDDWQGNFLYGTEIDAEIYQQYVELAKGYETAEAFRADMEEKYGEPGETDIAGEAATRFYQETWDEAHRPTPEPEAPPTVPIESPVIPGAATYDYQEKVDASRDIEDRELAAKVEAGEITEKGIDKLAGEAEVAEGIVTEKATKATEATEEALSGLTAEEQLAIKAGDELEAAMAERERVAGNEVKMLAIERRIKSLRTRLSNALAGNAHVAVIMDEQGAWKRILSREAPVEEAEAYVEGITFGREIQKIIDTEKAKGVLRETKVRMYAEKRAAVEKVKEDVRKAAAQRRAAKKLREVRRKLIAHIVRPPGRSIQFKGYAEQIRIIQKGLDPTMREYRIVNGVQVMEKTMKGYAREQTRRFFEENPEAAAQVPMEKLERFYSVNLPDMTLAQLEEIADSIDRLRKLGRLKRHLELAQKARAAANLKNRLEGAVLRGEEPEKVIGRAKRTGKSLALWIQTLTPRRVLSLLDGVFAGVKEGPFTELGWKRVNEAWGAFKKAERGRKTFVLNKMKELGFTLNPLAQLKGEEWVGRKFDIDGFLYSDGNMPTLQDVMYWYIGMKNERTAMALIEGNKLPPQVVMKGIAKLSEKERAMADAIDEDGSKNFARYRDAFIDTFNMDLPGEEHYVRMVRLKANYEMREDQAIVELTGRAGISKQFVARHSTYARIDIEAEHQKPIRMDLFNLWAEGVLEQEGFIQQYALVREMHNIFGSDQVTAAVQQKYGSVLNKWLKKYTSDLAQADAYRSMQGLDRIARKSRKHATVAWLGFNLLSVAKQSVGAYAFMADLGPLAPAYLLEASAKLAAGSVKAVAGGHFFHNTQVDFVKERSEFVRNRQISVDLENLKHIDPGLYSAIIGKIGKWGMKGLEVMDITTVCIGWTAVYDKVMHDTQGNEAKAIEAADAATIRNSPSARVQDLAEMYRHGEILKWFTMFTSELNVIWNRLTFDMPLAVRRMELYKALSDIVSITIAGVVIAIASGALQGDDEEKRKKLILGLFQEYVDSIPLIGNDIFAYISGKQFQASGVKLIPPVTMWMDTARQLTEGDWDMMVQKGLQALSFTVGLPHTAGKRAIKAIDERYLWALLGMKKE